MSPQLLPASRAGSIRPVTGTRVSPAAYDRGCARLRIVGGQVRVSRRFVVGVGAADLGLAALARLRRLTIRQALPRQRDRHARSSSRVTPDAAAGGRRPPPPARHRRRAPPAGRCRRAAPVPSPSPPSAGCTATTCACSPASAGRAPPLAKAPPAVGHARGSGARGRRCPPYGLHERVGRTGAVAGQPRRQRATWPPTCLPRAFVKPPSTGLEALLAAEHAAVYGYGTAGAVAGALPAPGALISAARTGTTPIA